MAGLRRCPFPMARAGRPHPTAPLPPSQILSKWRDMVADVSFAQNQAKAKALNALDRPHLAAELDTLRTLLPSPDNGFDDSLLSRAAGGGEVGECAARFACDTVFSHNDLLRCVRRRATQPRPALTRGPAQWQHSVQGEHGRGAAPRLRVRLLQPPRLRLGQPLLRVRGLRLRL